MRFLFLLAAMGCARVESNHTVELPAAGVWSMLADTDRGDIVYDGSGPENAFAVDVRSWAKGRTRGRAERRMANNTFGATVAGEWLDVWGRSEVGRAGVDLDVLGPRVFNVDAVTLNGTVSLYDVDGFHTVTATRVEGAGVWGDLDAYADGGGIDVEITPYDGSEIRIETLGNDAVVVLPWGLDYDLQVFADPDYGYDITDLGFDELILGPDYASGVSGAGSIRVTVLASGGGISVLESF